MNPGISKNTNSHYFLSGMVNYFYNFYNEKNRKKPQVRGSQKITTVEEWKPLFPFSCVFAGNLYFLLDMYFWKVNKDLEINLIKFSNKLFSSPGVKNT